MNRRTQYRRVLRRELHGSRAVPATALAVVLVLILAAIGTIVVLAALGQRTALDWTAAILTPATPAGSAALYGGCVLLGVLLVVTGSSPARRARHEMVADRAAVIVDDDVLASALAGEAARVAKIGVAQARAVVRRTRAVVVLTPVSGLAIDATAVSAALDRMVDAMRLRNRLRLRVVVSRDGEVGG